MGNLIINKGIHGIGAPFPFQCNSCSVQFATISLDVGGNCLSSFPVAPPVVVKAQLEVHSLSSGALRSATLHCLSVRDCKQSRLL